MECRSSVNSADVLCGLPAKAAHDFPVCFRLCYNLIEPQGLNMPIYEYWCRQCQRKVTLYLPTFSQSSPSCPQCGKNTLQRLFSTFSVRKTDKDVYEDILSDSQLTKAMLRDDPRALAEWNRRMSRGEEVAPEYKEMIDTMERGEMPAELAGTGTGESAEEAD